MSPRPLAVLFAALAACLPAAAQGVYYVDGVIGLDAPGRGTTAAAPWRTITYAMANATPTAAGVATVRIQGGQIYAPASNGETYPVILAPNIALEGVVAGGSLPVLAVPAGAIGLQLATTASYSNQTVVHRNLVVQGGAIGFNAGCALGLSHVATLEDCEFHGQATAGVRSFTFSGATDLTVRRCRLVGSVALSHGILQTVSTTGAAQRLEVANCLITGWGSGVRLDTATLNAWAITTIVRDTTVSQCGAGLSFLTPGSFGPFASSRTTTVSVERVRISDCGTGITDADAPASGSGHPFSATDLSIVRCTTGVSLRAASAPSIGQNSNGNYAPTFERAVIADCATGIDVFMSSGGTVRLNLRHADLLSNLDAVYVATTIGNCDLRIERCRMLDGARGITMPGGSMDVLGLQMTDSLIARQTAHAALTDYTSATFDRCTFADCGIGLRGIQVQGTASACLLSGNGIDAQFNNPIPTLFGFANSATDGVTTLPAGGNPPSLQFASVGLTRPYYKLARTSPVIDRVVTGGLDYEGDPRSVATNAGATVFGDIGADEYVPAGSLRRYGLPTYGAVPASPTIGSPNTTAVLGGSYTVQLAGAIAGSLPFLATGVEDVAAPLPNELGLIGLPGCHLWLDPIVLQTLPPVGATGATSAAVAIPNQAALLGFVLAHQWLVGLPLPDGFVTSDALRVTIGQ